jgi:predicted transcriptional regulator
MEGFSQQSIADQIGCHQATISRFLRKEMGA